MKTLQHFNEFVKEITSSNSKKFKQEVLQKYKDDEVIQKYLKIAFDPYVVYGLSTKKLSKHPAGIRPYPADSIFDLFQWLEEHNTGTDAAIKLCQETLGQVAAYNMELAALLEKLICKDLSIGVDAKSIAKVMPGVCRTFSVQLAQKYFEAPHRIEGKRFAITEKIDGGRIIAIKDNDKVEFYTRAGQRYEGLVDLEEEMLRTYPNGLVLDGEITILNDKGIPSKDAYKAAMRITRSDEPEKHGLKMKCFDAMYIDEWRNQNCTHDYIERRMLLEGIQGGVQHKYFEVLPELYRGDDTSKILELLDEMVAQGSEGIMLNVLDEKYSFDRTWGLQKVKKMKTLDLEVIGFLEGEGRLAGTLGAILVRYKDGNTVKVGSGFTDDLRKEIWTHQADWLGAICEIQYFETTKNDAGGESLRFPVYKDRRFDKTEADF